MLQLVIASEAKQSSLRLRQIRSGLLRRFAPRNDEEFSAHTLPIVMVATSVIPGRREGGEPGIRCGVAVSYQCSTARDSGSAFRAVRNDGVNYQRARPRNANGRAQGPAAGVSRRERNYFFLPLASNCLRKAMRSSIFLSSLMPANTILVPGILALGSLMYSRKVASSQVRPEFLFAGE